MVDALSRIRHWLAPTGTLVDIRPAPVPVSLEVVAADACSVAGHLADTDAERGPSIRHIRAEEAMKTALARGWYVVDAHDAFSFLHQADTLAVMRDHVASVWKHARFDEDSWRRAEAFMDGRRAAVVQLREEVIAARLRLAVITP
jgi:hypothetical protein